MNRKISFHVVAALAASTLVPMVHSEIVFNTYNHANDYKYAAYDMPDFDQRRFNALPNHGLCYCGPAATGNLLGYVSTHGFPEVNPGVPMFASWESDLNYNAATNLLNVLGTNTNVASGAGGPNAPCGTSSQALFNELADRLSSKFTVNLDASPTLEKIAQRGAYYSAIGLILYGRYDGSFDESGNFNSSSRRGGHFESVTVAMETSTMRRLAVRNPAGTDSPIDTVQSSFKSEWFDVIPQNMTWFGGASYPVERLGSAQLGNTRILVMESHVWIAPKCVYTWDEFTPNSFTFWMPELAHWTPQLPPPVPPLPFQFEKMQPVPNSPYLAAIIDREFQLLDRATGQPMPLPPLPSDSITDLDVDRYGQIHMAGDNQVISINPEPKMHTALPMPGEVVSIASASSNQQSPWSMTIPVAYALVSDPPMIAAILQDRDGLSTRFYALDSNMIINPDSMIVAMDEYLGILTNGVLDTFNIDLEGSRFTRSDIAAPLSNIRDMVADDDNVLLLSMPGEKIYTAWQLRDRYVEADWHALHRTESRGRLAVSRSADGTRPWSPILAESSAYDERDAESSSGSTADCRADFNFDGEVDGADLGLLLAEWGTGRSIADINRDGSVNGADLGLLLGAFGPCP